MNQIREKARRLLDIRVPYWEKEHTEEKENNKEREEGGEKGKRGFSGILRSVAGERVIPKMTPTRLVGGEEDLLVCVGVCFDSLDFSPFSFSFFVWGKGGEKGDGEGCLFEESMVVTPVGWRDRGVMGKEGKEREQGEEGEERMGGEVDEGRLLRWFVFHLYRFLERSERKKERVQVVVWGEKERDVIIESLYKASETGRFIFKSFLCLSIYFLNR